MSGESITTYQEALKSMTPERCDGCPALGLMIKDAKVLDLTERDRKLPNVFSNTSFILDHIMSGDELFAPDTEEVHDQKVFFEVIFGISPQQAIEANSEIKDPDVLAANLLNDLGDECVDKFDELTAKFEEKISRCAGADDTCRL